MSPARDSSRSSSGLSRPSRFTWHVATCLVAVLVAPGVASAQCTDTFNASFVPAGGTFPGPGEGTPYQHLFPLGVGSSLNALVSTMNTVNTAFLSPSSSFVSARGDASPDQLGGGVWGRIAAGWVDSKAVTSGSVDTSKARFTDFDGSPAPVPPVTGKGTCSGSLHEQYFGYQFGFDLAKLNVGSNGGNVHVGLTAGYFSSRSSDETADLLFTHASETPAHTLYSPPGSFDADIQVPFLGVYTAYTQGNFFFDAQVRHDLYLMKFTDPLNGLSGQSQNATGISAGANVGYKIPLAANWFIEPSGGMMWSRVRVDSITTPGSATFQFLNAGAVHIDDIESILGRVSLRAGTTINAGDVIWQPFGTATIFHEFADEATATSRIGGPENGASCAAFPDSCPPSGFFLNQYRNLALNTSTSRIGTYTQFGVGTATVFGNSGWIAYGRADYKTGDNVEGFNFNAGVRYHW